LFVIEVTSCPAGGEPGKYSVNAKNYADYTLLLIADVKVFLGVLNLEKATRESITGKRKDSSEIN